MSKRYSKREMITLSSDRAKFLPTQSLKPKLKGSVYGLSESAMSQREAGMAFVGRRQQRAGKGKWKRATGWWVGVVEKRRKKCYLLLTEALLVVVGKDRLIKLMVRR